MSARAGLAEQRCRRRARLPPGRNTAALVGHSSSNSGRTLSMVARDARHERDAVAGVADGVGEHVGQLPGAPVAQQQAPGAERAGHHGGQQAGAGDQVEAELARSARASPAGGRRPGRRRRAACRLAALCRMIGASPPGPFRCGSATCRVKAAAHGGVERVAAALQHRHADLAREPVRAGDDAERAGDLGAGGEHAARAPDGLGLEAG